MLAKIKTLSKETILLIEDNAENVEFMVDYLLTPNGYNPIVASDGRQGLEMALTTNPDLIILDFKLPGMSGIQVLEALRENQVDIPVIFITAYGSEEDIVSCFRLGIKDYFRKPFDIERMLATIEQVLSEDRQQKQQIAQRRELEEYVKELGTLYGSSLERVLNRIVEIAVALTGAEEGYLLLVDRQTDELYMRSALNLGERFAREFRIRIQDSITGRVVQTGEPVMYNGLDDADRFKVKTGYLVKALINVPLRSNDKVIGVLGIDNRLSPNTFGRADQDLLCLLAEHADHGHRERQPLRTDSQRPCSTGQRVPGYARCSTRSERHNGHGAHCTPGAPVCAAHGTRGSGLDRADDAYRQIEPISGHSARELDAVRLYCSADRKQDVAPPLGHRKHW